MVLGKKRKLGRTFEEITLGEKLTLTEKVEDKDLLLYLGLTNDANPLFIQHDYATQTTFEKPVVPSIMLTGIVLSAVSKYLPGPGSYIQSQQIDFLAPVYHYEVIHFLFEVVDKDEKLKRISIKVQVKNEEGKEVLTGRMSVCPPQKMKKMDGKSLENF
ncbi:MaoC/PaaZ C-terminal domain-containing protein [Bacillus carboniphilus]|uniref:MaoC/PaaZ C-terminal domain-containing protein n=1 Tax=Bacillus carboniphilus TaxID=86663 RepID=A0ABY9K0Q7_9BACI|nr:MaoC/PaaZ C-terminal domain-containing protein [Bacillus carboniphilus]WLR44163.1 MaoC/PaaZ C-terminal domain-containing protein [Bacillus carboniphilus]